MDTEHPVVTVNKINVTVYKITYKAEDHKGKALPKECTKICIVLFYRDCITEYNRN